MRKKRRQIFAWTERYCNEKRYMEAGMQRSILTEWGRKPRKKWAGISLLIKRMFCLYNLELSTSIDTFEWQTLVILDKMTRFFWHLGVLLHHVVIHERDPSEEGEAARGAQGTPDHVLCGFLKPVSNGVLEFLVPADRACCSPNRLSLD